MYTSHLNVLTGQKTTRNFICLTIADILRVKLLCRQHLLSSSSSSSGFESLEHCSNLRISKILLYLFSKIITPQVSIVHPTSESKVG